MEKAFEYLKNERWITFLTISIIIITIIIGTNITMIIGLTTTNVTQYLDCILLKVTRCFLLPSFEINKSSFQSAISVINLTLFQWGCNPTPHKNLFFQSNTYNIKVKIISFIEMPKLPNLSIICPVKKLCWWRQHIIWCHKVFFKIQLF